MTGKSRGTSNAVVVSTYRSRVVDPDRLFAGRFGGNRQFRTMRPYVDTGEYCRVRM